MIGLGIDLCDIERLRILTEKTPAFLNKYYTDAERSYIQSRGVAAAQSMAAIYAAKEAFWKAMGCGITGTASLGEVEILHRESGSPYYHLSGKAKEMAEVRGVKTVYLSLTHEKDMAAAVCIL